MTIKINFHDGYDQEVQNLTFDTPMKVVQFLVDEYDQTLPCLDEYYHDHRYDIEKGLIDYDDLPHTYDEMITYLTGVVEDYDDGEEGKWLIEEV